MHVISAIVMLINTNYINKNFSKQKCIIYISLCEIDSEGRLRTKLYDKRDDFNFPIVNFPSICSKIPAAPAYGVHISQLIFQSLWFLSGFP